MPKPTRYKYSVANQRGKSLTKAANYTLTESDILKLGYSFIIASTGATITLPVASDLYKGVSLYVTATDQCSVYVAAGFGGGGGSYDSVALGSYESAEFWCDGTYWYALNVTVGAAGSSSSSSSSSSSISSSSSSSSSISSSSSSSSSSSVSSSSSSISSSSVSSSSSSSSSSSVSSSSSSSSKSSSSSSSFF